MNDPMLARLPSWAELLQRYEQPGEPEYEVDTFHASSETHEPRFSTFPGPTPNQHRPASSSFRADDDRRAKTTLIGSRPGLDACSRTDVPHRDKRVAQSTLNRATTVHVRSTSIDRTDDLDVISPPNDLRRIPTWPPEHRASRAS